MTTGAESLSEPSAEPSSEISPTRRPLEDLLGARLVTITPQQATFISWISDILVYIVVLNLFSEFFPEHIHIGSFWVSILAAVLFKVLLVIVGKADHKVHHSLSERGLEIAAVVGAFLVLFFGKLAIIEIINRLFEEVEMHGLLYEASMIITMIIASMVLWKIFDELGRDQSAKSAVRVK